MGKVEESGKNSGIGGEGLGMECELRNRNEKMKLGVESISYWGRRVLRQHQNVPNPHVKNATIKPTHENIICTLQ